nr:MAG TPA: hypothetical protein [Caudoviricetes sp.]
MDYIVTPDKESGYCKEPYFDLLSDTDKAIESISNTLRDDATLDVRMISEAYRKYIQVHYRRTKFNISTRANLLVIERSADTYTELSYIMGNDETVFINKSLVHQCVIDTSKGLVMDGSYEYNYKSII